MKQKVTFMSIGLFLLMTNLFAQTPVNTCIPRTTAPTVNVWDWRQKLWEWYYPDVPTGQAVLNMLENPYWATPSMVNANIIDLANTLNKDYDPADGWELLTRAMGSPGTNNYGKLNPYVLLYNKYTGTIRVFLNITSFYEANSVVIKLSFQQGSSQTALLSSNTAIALPVSDYGSNKQILMPNQIANFGTLIGTYWLFADFQIMYDPCTCNVPATIHVAGYLVKDMTITANIKNTNQTDNIMSGGATTDLNFKSAISLVGGTAEAAKKYYESGDKFVQSVDAFQKSNAAKAIANKSTSAQKISNTLQKVAPALSAVPYVGAFVGAASFVMSFFKGSSNQSTVAAFPNVDLTMNGTINTKSPYGDIFLNVPGADQSLKSTDYNPIYNNILGVFSLLENPSVEYKDYLPSPAYRGAGTYVYPIPTGFHGAPVEAQFKFPNVREYKVNQVPYVINSASGLQLFDMQARLLITTNKIPKKAISTHAGIMYVDYDTTTKSLFGPYETYPFSNQPYNTRLKSQNGIEIENWPNQKNITGITYSTDFVPISCFYDSRFKMFYYDNSEPEIKCELLVTLIPTNGDVTKKVFIKLTYNVNSAPSTLAGTKYYYTEQVVTPPAYRVPATYDFKITSIDQYWPNAYPSTTCSGAKPALTNTEVATFCSSTKYKSPVANYPTNFYRTVDNGLSMVDEDLPIYAKIVPNPYSSGDGYIEFNQYTAGNSKIKLLDITGNESIEVYNAFTESGVHQVSLPAEDLSDGMYLCIIETPDGTQKEKLIIIK